MLHEYNVEELHQLEDAAIKNLFLSIRSKIFKNKKNKMDCRDLEIYYCYIVREIENRK